MEARDPSAALLGDGGRKLDAELARMIRRVIEIVQARPGRRRAISMVFSKLDRVLHRAMPPDHDPRRRADAWSDLGKRSSRIFRALEDAGSTGFPWNVFPTTAFPGPLGSTQPTGVDAPFAFVLEHADRRERWPRRVQPIPAHASSFDAMRRWPPPPGEQP